MSSHDRKIKKYIKPVQRSTSNNLLSILFVIVLVTVIFIIVSTHSHLQLSAIEDNPNQFIKNKIVTIEKNFMNYSYKLRHGLNAYVQQNIPDYRNIAFDDKVMNIHETIRLKDHTLNCPHSHLVRYWRPPLFKDITYKSPYQSHSSWSSSGRHNRPTKYVTFEPDVGGWNNIRMQMEVVLVFALMTKRTLVLPPDQPMYLLNAGKGHQKAHSFEDFFPFDHIRQILPVITMDEFLNKEGKNGQLKRQWNVLNKGHGIQNEIVYPPHNKSNFDCTIREEKWVLWEYIRNVTTIAPWQTPEEFVIIPKHILNTKKSITTQLSESSNSNTDIDIDTDIDTDVIESKRVIDNYLLSINHTKRYQDFISNRTPQIYTDTWHNQKVIHFTTNIPMNLRLLQPYYTFLYYEDEYMDRLSKRFVRDYIHYIGDMFCKAALIIQKLLEISGGHYTAFHIRRGEFQFKNVKITAEQLLTNLNTVLPTTSLLYIATDEKNKSFFDPLKEKYTHIKFLDDYIDYAELQSVNPNYLGMIEQIICARGDYFVGTWFSTFSSYITRMRGYLGYHDYTTWYGDKEHRDRFHIDELPKFPFYMREWNISWVNIDESK